jgi:RP/EB family microtubule-associated protein
MDQAYFTGRKELLDFFNDLLELNLAKIEQTATGAVACQLTEYVYPKSIDMRKVNWEAKSDYEYVQNYKLLQIAFRKHKVQRYVDVEKLIKCKYQDNLEFCQWLKAFFDQSGAFNEEYDATAVRNKGKGGTKATKILQKNASTFGSKPIPTGPRASTSAFPTPRPAAPRATTTRTTAPAPARTSTTRAATSTRTSTRNSSSSLKENNSKNKDHLTEAVLADAQLMKKNSDLTTKVTQLEVSLQEMETERDFYFDKLRDVEIMLQVFKESDHSDPKHMVENVFKVLYATMEEQVAVGENGEILLDDEFDLLTG